MGGIFVCFVAGQGLFRAGVLRGAVEARPASAFDGAVLLLLNPKAYVIIALMFTQFLHGVTGPKVPMVLLITTVFTLNNMVAFALWTVLGDQIARHFRTPSHAVWLNMGFGVLLAGVAVWMLLA